MRPTGVRLGVDFGLTRIGVAKSDPHGIMAFPLMTITTSESAVSELINVIVSVEASVVYIGNPLNLQAQATQSTQNAHTFALDLVRALVTQNAMVPVHLVDERLSTKSAQGRLHQAGHNTKSSKSKIDQAAAVVILEHALDTERISEQPAGQLIYEE